MFLRDFQEKAGCWRGTAQAGIGHVGARLRIIAAARGGLRARPPTLLPGAECPFRSSSLGFLQASPSLRCGGAWVAWVVGLIHFCSHSSLFRYSIARRSLAAPSPDVPIGASGIPPPDPSFRSPKRMPRFAGLFEEYKPRLVGERLLDLACLTPSLSATFSGQGLRKLQKANLKRISRVPSAILDPPRNPAAKPGLQAS